VIIFPTLFFIFSQILRLVLKSTTKKELTDIGVSLRSETLLKSVGRQFTTELRWEFFIDSIILSMVNGLILMFELNRFESGTILLVGGIIISVSGFVVTHAKMDSAVGFLMFLLFLLFVSEAFYFAAFGTTFSLLGFIILPWHIFLFPSLVFIVVIALGAAVYSKRKNKN